MRIPEIFPSDPIQRQKVLSTVLMDFSADPCLLWVCPEAGNYINFTGTLDAYRGSQSILIRPMWWGGFKGTAHWLPPTKEAEEEAFVKEVEQIVLREKRESLYKVLEEVEEYHPEALYVPPCNCG